LKERITAASFTAKKDGTLHNPDLRLKRNEIFYDHAYNCNLFATHTMKNYTLLFLAIVAVITMLYAGINGIMNDYYYGAFLTFIGACTAIGLSIDVYNVIQLWIRKSNIRKLGPRF
jgi:hypothetical protein